MTRIFLRRVGLVLLLFALFAPTRATAGPVYLWLTVDPATTAGAGVPTIARQFSSGSFSVTSTQFGAGKWHLYALDDVTGSLGIAGFSVSLSSPGGTITVLNRSPNATYTNYGDVDETVIDTTGSAGFSDALVRSGVGANPANPVQGNQIIGSLQDIAGFGQTTGNFNNVPNNPAPGDHRIWGGVTSGQWGNYATTPTFAQLVVINNQAANAALTKKWIFLGEGQYTGASFGSPVVFTSAAINIYDSSQGGALHQTPLTPAMGGIVLLPSPEPSSIALVGLAATANIGVARRRRA